MFDDELVRNLETNTGQKMIMYSPAQLAYAGDAVYELLVRSYLISRHDFNVNSMHKHAVKYVKAESQAGLIKRLDSILTDEEKRIVKRGRNAKVTSSPKNADPSDYRYATGFEALFGYLYLNQERARLMYLFNRIIDMIEEDDEHETDRG